MSDNTQPPYSYSPGKPSPMRVKYFLLVFFISIFFLGRILYPFWSILVLAFLLSGLFRPAYSFFNRKLPAPVCSILTCMIITLIVFIPLIFFITALSNEALTVYQWGRSSDIWIKLQVFIQESETIAEIQQYLLDLGIEFNPTQISDSLSILVRTAGLELFNQANRWAANIARLVFLFVILMLVVFFLLMDLPKLIDYLTKLSPLPDEEDRLLLNKFQQIANAVLKGNGICGIIQGVLGGVAFSLIGFSSPLLWGSIMGILAFLPIVGISIVMIPAIAILLISERFVTAVVLFVFYVILSFTVENLLKPKLVGSEVKMHTLLVFLSIIGGLAVYGILGIIYGPLIVTAFMTLADIYLKKYDAYVQTH
jgi:predicted PurR-regulated permease PerM